MCVWCGKSGYDFGIGKSEYSMRSRDVLMCSERYADDIPLVLPIDPVAADAVGLLVAVEVEAVLVEGLGGGDAGRAGADHADGGKIRHAAEP